MKVRETTALFTALITASLLYQTPGAEETFEGELVWIEGDSQVAVDLSSSIELTCHVKIPALANVLWVKVNDDGSEIIAHDERLLIENNRITVNYNASGGISVLKVENANNKDSGRYECQVPMMNSTINAAIEVLVKEDSEESSSSEDNALPTNTSLPDGGIVIVSMGHSITNSVLLIASFAFLCVTLNVIPDVMQY